MNKRYRITINKRGHIPGVGNGPITRPITVSQKIYDQLVKLGYPITVVQDLAAAPIVRPAFVNPTIEEVVEPPVNETQEESNSEEVVNETPAEEVVQDIKATEEIIDNEEIVDSESEVNEEDTEDVVEVIVDDKDLSADAYYTEGFLSSKNMCKKILDARQVSYDNSASFTVLKQLVSESNPDVEVVEEDE